MQPQCCEVRVENDEYDYLVPRPFLVVGEKKRRRKGLVNNSTLMWIHGCIPAVSVDEGKRECQLSRRES